MFGGGLFGDLPEETNKKKSQQPAASPPDNSHSHNKTTPEPEPKKARQQDPLSSKPSSLVGALGNAGTTVAFLPASLSSQNKKKQQQQQQQAALQQRIKLALNSAKKKKQQQEKTKEQEEQGKLTKPQQHTKTDTNESHTQTQNEPGKHDLKTSEQQQISAASPSSVVIEDPYDPMEPNDYLKYKEEQRINAKRAQLRRKALQDMEEARALREQMKEMVAAANASSATSNAPAMVMSTSGQEANSALKENTLDQVPPTMGRGRGRGRGALNLPAWMTQNKTGTSTPSPSSNTSTTPHAERSMYHSTTNTTTSTVAQGLGRGRGQSNLPAWMTRATQQANTAPSSTTSAAAPVDAPPRTDTTPSKVVILSNLLPPPTQHYTPDSELHEEVKEECEETCGPVQHISSYLDSHGDIQVKVVFETLQHPQRAVEVFGGRSFGGRTIQARFGGAG